MAEVKPFTQLLYLPSLNVVYQASVDYDESAASLSSDLQNNSSPKIDATISRVLQMVAAPTGPQLPKQFSVDLPASSLRLHISPALKPWTYGSRISLKLQSTAIEPGGHLYLACAPEKIQITISRLQIV